MFSQIVRRVSSNSSSVLPPKPISNVEEILIKSSSHIPSAQSDPTVATSTFDQLRLRNDVLTAINSLNITRPTLIQYLAIPKILRGKNVMCTSETGSGKTLAYLAPLMSRLKEEELTHGVVTRLRKPRALIVVPSRDLANQVLMMSKSLSHVIKMRALGLIGGKKRKFIKDSLMRPVDVAIATPDALMRLKREERISFADLSHLVIDEADTLFDTSFQDCLSFILKSIKFREAKPKAPTDLGKDTQVTIVSATLTDKMSKRLNEIIPNLNRVTSKQLHKILPNVEQKFVKVLPNDKADRLLKELKSRPNAHTIIFCNTVPSCDWTVRYLETHHVPVVKLHGGLNPLERSSLLKEFTEGNSKVLVCTDIASRGIDCTKVTQIIQFDWPYSITDYLHRVGRTGRVGGSTGQKCRALAFMTRRRDVRMAWLIKDCADKRESLLNKKVARNFNIHCRPPPRKIRTFYKSKKPTTTATTNSSSSTAGVTS